MFTNRRYDQLQLIEESETGKLFRAKDTIENRFVLIKTVLKQTVRPVRNMNTFKEIEHTNLIKIYDIETDEQPPYIVMEDMQGESLQSMIKNEAPLPVDKALAIAIQLCDALAYIHDMGIQHQQVQPRHIFCTKQGIFKLLYMEAPNLHEDQHLLIEDEVRFYLAPEQYQGFYLSNSTDLYALSIVLYEMVTGKTPTQNGRDHQVLVDQAIFDPDHIGVELPAELIKLIQQGISIRRYKRFQSAEEMRQKLLNVYYQVCQTSIVKSSASQKQVENGSNEKLKFVQIKQYRWRIVGTVAVMMFVFLLVGNSVMDRNLFSVPETKSQHDFVTKSIYAPYEQPERMELKELHAITNKKSDRQTIVKKSDRQTEHKQESKLTTAHKDHSKQTTQTTKPTSTLMMSGVNRSTNNKKTVSPSKKVDTLQTR
ncbi:Serine/threonine protein kinase [Seinonella peptonophila]|uniref:non-specific serine/threonine protein kinase n=1 Tax=Seinonella peptonophila TaxID=112248 RepID=A0A1M4Y451_9BACL|nr:serine/threonine-protein kinase [Seinonella peptonophila]SHF00485.1 Serine/threonine protein kinase [Seinonella peptonophila]